MTLDQLKTNLLELKQKVQRFRRLLVESRDSVMPESTRNHQLIAQMRSELNVDYGKLERSIRKFGNNPRMSDGVNPVFYPVYNNAFSSDILLRVGPSLDAVIQDLEYIAGKLNGMTDDEFREALQPPRQEKAPVMPSGNSWHTTNRSGWWWKFAKLIWQHKVASLIITLLGLSAIDYSLAWQNVIWLKDFFLRIF